MPSLTQPSTVTQAWDQHHEWGQCGIHCLARGTLVHDISGDGSSDLPVGREPTVPTAQLITWCLKFQEVLKKEKVIS